MRATPDNCSLGQLSFIQFSAHSFIHRYLLSAYYAPGAMSGLTQSHIPFSIVSSLKKKLDKP